MKGRIIIPLLKLQSAVPDPRADARGVETQHLLKTLARGGTVSEQPGTLSPREEDIEVVQAATVPLDHRKVVERLPAQGA
jgi:hypothetical protein